MRKLMIGLAPALIAIGTSAAAAPTWRVSEVSGEVRLTEEGRTRAAVKGALLASGAMITTGPRARAVIVRGEEFVMISPRSQLRVPAAEAPNRIMQIIEDFGTAVFKIEKKSTPHFGVQTPFLAAVVKGTTFTVTVGAEGGSVQVTEGAVQVSTLDGGAADLIRPGDIAMVGASDLYQLTVEGAETKVLRSEQAPAADAVRPGSQPVAGYAGPPPAAVRIDAPLQENPQSLSEVTAGLLDGGAIMEMAAVEFADQSRASMVAPPDRGPGTGDKPGKDDDRPGKDDDKPGKDDGGKPGKDDGGKPGQDNGGTPGSDHGGKPGRDDGKPGKDDDRPGQDDGGKPGSGGDDGRGGGDDDDDGRGEDRPDHDDGRGDDGPDDDDDDDRDDDGRDGRPGGDDDHGGKGKD